MEDMMESAAPKTRGIIGRLFDRPFAAGFWLIAAIPVSMLIAWPLSLAIGMSDFDDPMVFVILGGVHAAAGFLWSRTLSRRTGLEDNRWMNLAAGLAYAYLVVGFRANFPEGLFGWIADQLSFSGKTHLEFGTIFVLWTGIVTGGTGMALGIGRADWRLARRLLFAGFITGAGFFLLTAFVMDLAGLRVGAPGVVAMLPTTFLGIWGAALSGSEVIGRELAKFAQGGKPDALDPVFYGEVFRSE